MNWFIEIAKIGSPLAVVVAGFVYIFKLQTELWGNHSKHLTESIDKLTEAVEKNTQAQAKQNAYSKGKSNAHK